MKKIVFFVKNIYERGGIPNVVANVANALSSNDTYKITIISLFKTDEKVAYDIDDSISIESIFDKEINIRFNYIKILKEYKKIVCKIMPNIMIVSGIGFFHMNYYAAKHLKNKCSLIGWEHSCFGDWKVGGLSWLGYRFLKKYNSLVVLTDGNKLKYDECNLNIPIKKIYNPIDFKEESNIYLSDSKTIISAGDFIYRKGFDLIPEIGKNIFTIFPEWKWYIYGEGSEKDIIQKKVDSYNLNNNIILSGYTTDLDSKYKNAALFVSTAREEAFGMVIIEAQKNSLPVVAFQTYGPSELIIDEINGNIIENQNIAKMCDCLVELMNNEKKRKSYSKHSRDLFYNYSLETIRIEWENLLNEF